MTNQGYPSFAAWKEDMDRVRAHPNDTQLLSYVIRRVQVSSEEVKREVQDHLTGIALEKNPWTVFKQIAKENKKHILIVNGQEDPWFKV